MAPTARSDLSAPRKRSRKQTLLSHRLKKHSLGALAVPLSVEHPLPRAKIELPLGHRHDHLVSNRKRAQMRRGVVFAGTAVVPVVLGCPRCDSVLQPVENVLP